MMPIVDGLIVFVVGGFRSRIALQLEIVALRHQLALYRRSIRRLRVRPSDRIFWSWLARHWTRWQEVLMFVQPATVIAWQRRRFRGIGRGSARKEQAGQRSAKKSGT